MEKLCRVSARHHASTHGGALQRENQHLFEMVGEARFRRNSAGGRSETGVPPQSPKLAAYLQDIAEK